MTANARGNDPKLAVLRRRRISQGMEQGPCVGFLFANFEKIPYGQRLDQEGLNAQQVAGATKPQP